MFSVSVGLIRKQTGDVVQTRMPSVVRAEASLEVSGVSGRLCRMCLGGREQVSDVVVLWCYYNTSPDLGDPGKGPWHPAGSRPHSRTLCLVVWNVGFRARLPRFECGSGTADSSSSCPLCAGLWSSEPGDSGASLQAVGGWEVCPAQGAGHAAWEGVPNLRATPGPPGPGPDGWGRDLGTGFRTQTQCWAL